MVHTGLSCDFRLLHLPDLGVFFDTLCMCYGCEKHCHHLFLHILNFYTVFLWGCESRHYSVEPCRRHSVVHFDMLILSRLASPKHEHYVVVTSDCCRTLTVTCVFMVHVQYVVVLVNTRCSTSLLSVEHRCRHWNFTEVSRMQIQLKRRQIYFS